MRQSLPPRADVCASTDLLTEHTNHLQMANKNRTSSLLKIGTINSTTTQISSIPQTLSRTIENHLRRIEAIHRSETEIQGGRNRGVGQATGHIAGDLYIHYQLGTRLAYDSIEVASSYIYIYIDRRSTVVLPQI